MPEKVTLLKDIITAATICLSPSVAWITFYFNWRQKYYERRELLRKKLYEIKKEVEYIGNWAANEYNAESQSDLWYNPLWRVTEFPYERIREFIQTIEINDIGKSLSNALVSLDTAIARFKYLLKAHTDYVLDLVKSGIDITVKYDMRQPEQEEWRKELYNKNKNIHVKGIGTSGNKEGLHSTWKSATTEIDNALAGLRKSSQPIYLFIGHVLTFILGIIGLVSLILFFYVLIRGDLPSNFALFVGVRTRLVP